MTLKRTMTRSVGLATLALAGVLGTAFTASAIPFADRLTEGSTGHIYGHDEAEAFIKKLHADYPDFAAEMEKQRAPGQILNDTEEFNLLLDKRSRLIYAVGKVGREEKYADTAFNILTEMYRVSYAQLKAKTDPFGNTSYNPEILLMEMDDVVTADHTVPRGFLVNPAAEFFRFVFKNDPNDSVRGKALMYLGGMADIDGKLIPEFESLLEKHKDDPGVSFAVRLERDIRGWRELKAPVPKP